MSFHKKITVKNSDGDVLSSLMEKMENLDSIKDIMCDENYIKFLSWEEGLNTIEIINRSEE